MAVRDLDWESQDPPGSTSEDERGFDDEEFGESDELDDEEEEDEGDIGDEGPGHRG